MNDLARLAELLRERNAIDARIAALIGRPATTGHLGEFIASRIFGIELMESASHKGIDGHFASGPLAGRSVDVKYYLKQEGLLDISQDAPPDFFLVLAGPRSPAASSRGQSRPHVIDAVCLFEALPLIAELTANNVKVGIATSVRRDLWEQAEIHPVQQNGAIPLTGGQREMLSLFASRQMS